MIKRVYIVANEKAGGQATTLSQMTDILEDAGIQYDLVKLGKNVSIKRTLTEEKLKKYDAIVA